MALRNSEVFHAQHGIENFFGGEAISENTAIYRGQHKIYKQTIRVFCFKLKSIGKCTVS